MDTDIVEIAEKYLTKIRKTGPDNILALCPFHDNTDTPSFTMSMTKGLFFCFSCGAKGNLNTFLRLVGVTRVVIDRHYQRIIDRVSAYVPKPMNQKKPSLFTGDSIPEGTLGIFDYCPIDLVDQGFPEQLLQQYDVGFDKDHMRITFPLRDLMGRLIGISGRAVLNESPRYKVYDHEYEKWGMPPHKTDKRYVLWNADRIYPSAFFQIAPKIVIVEGFKACLKLIQHGVPNTVALLGTYLSPEHRWILERIGGEVYVMLDNNEAGRKGTARVASQLATSMTVKVVEYDEDKPQPSDLGPIEIHEALSGAKDYFLWAMQEKNKWLLERIPTT